MNIRIPITNEIAVVPCDIYIKVKVSPIVYHAKANIDGMLVEKALEAIEINLQKEVEKAIDKVLKKEGDNDMK